jgi:putative flippase GtrA
MKLLATVKRLSKLWVTGLLGTAIDMFWLFIFSRYFFHGDFLIYYIAPVISFELATFCNFNLAHYWVWKDRHVHGFYLQRLIKYNAVRMFAFSIKMIFLLIFKYTFHWDVLICNLGGYLFTFFINFLVYEKIVFKKKSTDT